MRIVLVTIYFFAFTCATLAQNDKSVSILISVKEGVSKIKLTEIPYVPGSVKISDESVNIREDIDLLHVYTTSSLAIDSIKISFTMLPEEFHKVHYNRSIGSYDSMKFNRNKSSQVQGWIPLQQDAVLPSSSLNKSGSLTRGVAFGNTQNMGMTSSLNLVLDGKLSDDVNIRAIISDQNIPFQPEGNTENLQNLDQVFVELSGKNFSVQAGDLLLSSAPSNYFLNYRRSLQGLQLTSERNIAGQKAETQLLAGLLKGKFTTVNVSVNDGVAGPYRIPGPGAEKFVIILANSERVFLDGQQLQRGFNHDYIIDYNLGEITFTNKIILTRYSRVRIEYEYTNLQYQRSVTAARHTQQYAKKNELTVNWYRERDNPFSPQFMEFDEDTYRLLASAADHPEGISIKRADSVAFNQQKTLYKKLYKQVAGQVYEVYEYSINPDSAFYQLSFSYMGTNKGNYVEQRGTANHKVYIWVEPIAGVLQGDYEPVILLQTPTERQLLSISNTTKINEYENVQVEYASSVFDQNNLSDIDNANDKGHALRLSLNSSGREMPGLTNYTLHVFADAELNTRNFNGIDRFRLMEFERDWNISPELLELEARQHFINTGFSLTKSASEKITYRVGLRSKKDAFSGLQQEASILHRVGKFQFSGQAFLLNADQHNEIHSNWTRVNTELSYAAGKVVPGYGFRSDNNQMRYILTDSLAGSWMNFEEHRFFIRNGKESPYLFELAHSIRDDKLPLSGDLIPASKAHTSTLSWGIRPADQRSFQLSLVHRHVDNYDQLGYVVPNAALNGRLDWKHHFFDKHIRIDLTYTLNNSRELRREYTYIQVPAGQGTHTWRDENGDGVQDISEFYEAINFDERNYIRVLLPGSDFVPAYESMLNYRMHADLPRAWKQETGLKKVLSTFSNLSTWQSTAKTTSASLLDRAASFWHITDSHDLLAGRELFRNTLFFNRAHPVYGAELNYSSNSNKRLHIAGFESEQSEMMQLISRINMASQYMFQLKVDDQARTVASDFLNGRNYEIRQRQYAPSLAWQPFNYFRITGRYALMNKHGERRSEEGSTESAKHKEWSTELRWNKSLESNFQFQLRWIEIEYAGTTNNALAYELLNALQPGNNITWSMNYLRKLGSGMQMSLNYEGRKSAEFKTVHIGRVMITALF